MNRNKQTGYTLIELLIVVAIIGLLASIVFAAMKTSRNRAQKTSYVQTLSEVQKGLEIYFSENGAYPLPGTNCVLYNNIQDPPNCWTQFQNIMKPYVGTLPMALNTDVIWAISYNRTGIYTFTRPGIPWNCLVTGVNGYFLHAVYWLPIPGVTVNYPSNANSQNLLGGDARIGRWTGTDCR